MNAPRAIMQMLLVPPILFFATVAGGAPIHSSQWPDFVRPVIGYLVVGVCACALAALVRNFAAMWAESAQLAWVGPTLLLVIEIVQKRGHDILILFADLPGNDEAGLGFVFFTLPAFGAAIYSILAARRK